LETLLDLVTEEKMRKIENKLEVEKGRVIKSLTGSVIYEDFNEIEILIGGDTNDYFFIPIMELEDEIRSICPFVFDLGINILPWIDVSICGLKARGSVSDLFTQSNLPSLTDQQIEDYEQLIEDIQRIYRLLRVEVTVDFERVDYEEDQVAADDDNEEDREIKVVDVW
jgi:hypothetical protein